MHRSTFHAPASPTHRRATGSRRGATGRQPGAWRWGLALLLALGLLPGVAQAWIYDLQPGKRASDVRSLLAPRAVLSDKVTINGHDGTLDLGVTDYSLIDAAARLGPLLKERPVAANATSLLIEGEDDRHWRTRFYLISMGAGYKTLVFTLRLPAAAFTGKADTWPRSLPEPRASHITMALQLERRGITMGGFRSAAPAAALFREYDAQLRADGWQPVFSDERSGAVYQIREHLLTFSAGDTRTGSEATVILRRTR